MTAVPPETNAIALRRGLYHGKTVMAGVAGVFLPAIYPNEEARYVRTDFFLDDMRCYLWDEHWAPQPDITSVVDVP